MKHVPPEIISAVFRSTCPSHHEAVLGFIRYQLFKYSVYLEKKLHKKKATLCTFTNSIINE
jgi:hypothetical protein